MEKRRLYYFDTDVLIFLDKCNLIGKLKHFKRRADTKLFITHAIKDELNGAKRSQPTMKYGMPKSIVNAISEGTIVVRDDNLDERKRERKAKNLGLGSGEISLIALMECDSKNQFVEPVLVTDDVRAYRKAREKNMKGCNIGQLMQYLCKSTQA